MPIRVICPTCKLPQEVPEAAAGKVAECTGCKTKFPVPGKKICVKCGKDVAQLKRSKDQHGKYWCMDCLQKVTTLPRQPAGAAPAAAPPAAVEPAPPPAAKPPVMIEAKAAGRPPAAVTPAAQPEAGDELPLRPPGAPEELPEPAVAGTPAEGSPAAAEPEGSPAAAEAEEAVSASAQAVFKALKRIQWPKRCVGCFAEGPQQSVKLSVAKATEIGAGTKMGRLSAIVRGLTMRLTSAGRNERGHYDLPVCDNCCAKLSPEQIAALGGAGDDEEPPPYRVETPLLVREMDRKCVVLTFHDQDYAAAFAEANPGLVFETIEDCLAALEAKSEAPPQPPPQEPAAEPAPQVEAEAPAPAVEPALEPPAEQTSAPPRPSPPSGRPTARRPAPTAQSTEQKLAPAAETPPSLPAAVLPGDAGGLAAAEERAEQEEVQAPEPAAQPPPAQPPARRKAASAPPAQAAALPPAAAQAAVAAATEGGEELPVVGDDLEVVEEPAEAAQASPAPAQQAHLPAAAVPEASPAPAARLDVRQLAKPHLPAGPVKAIGAAYWDAAGTLVVKIGALLGKKEQATVEKEHRAGILAVVGDKLVVVDLGLISGEDLTLEKLQALGPAAVKSARLRGLTAQQAESATEAVLELHGAFEMTATFPVSFGADNPAQAAAIATAIKCT